VKQETWSALTLAAPVLWIEDLPLTLVAQLWSVEVLPLISAAPVLGTEELSQLPAVAARQASIEAQERQSVSTRVQRGIRS
jgi:hypothetical protein